MMHLNEDNKEIDVVTLMDQLSTEGTLNEAGGLISYRVIYKCTNDAKCSVLY